MTKKERTAARRSPYGMEQHTATPAHGPITIEYTHGIGRVHPYLTPFEPLVEAMDPGEPQLGPPSYDVASATFEVNGKVDRLPTEPVDADLPS